MNRASQRHHESGGLDGHIAAFQGALSKKVPLGQPDACGPPHVFYERGRLPSLSRSSVLNASL